MKKLNELKSERSDIVTKMEEISKTETLTEEQRSSWNDLDNQVKKIDDDIILLERQEKLNINNISTPEIVSTEEVKPMGIQFRDWLYESVENGGKTASFRADPIITSTDSAIINKTVNAGVDILQSPAEAFLRQVGVTFFTGLTGQLVIPSMAEDTAAFPGENTGAASASMATASLTLAARRVSHTQAISKETLSETNPTIYSSILQNLLNGVWNCVTNDVFDTLQTDAPEQVQTAGITFAAIAAMEASLAYSNIGGVNFVTTPANRATLKVTAKMSNQAPIWGDDNTVLGYPAFAVPAANSTMMYMGDFSKCAVGQWGALEIVVDPYTDAKKGLINLTVVGLFDTGCYNPRGIVWKANA